MLMNNQAWSTPINLVDIQTKANLAYTSASLQLLQDSQHLIHPQAALAQPHWQPADIETLNIGLSQDTYWLKLEITNTCEQTVTRWFSLGSPRIQNIYFYQLNELHQLIKVYRGGSNHPISHRPVITGLSNVFDVSLDPGETHTILIRASSDTSITLIPELWTPVAYREYEGKQKVTDLIFMIVILTIGLYLFTTGLVRRDWVMFNMGGWLFASSFYELAFFGYVHEYLLPQGGLLVGALPVTMALIGIIFMFQFLYIALQAHQNRFWQYFIQGSSLFFLSIIFMAYFVDLHLAILLSNNTIFIYILLFPLIIFLRWKHRLAHTNAFLIASLIFVVLISHRTFYVLGIFNHPLHEYGLIWSLLLISLALSLLIGFATRSVALYREQIQNQNQLIALQQQAQHTLENAVERRTQELQHTLIQADEANRAKSDFLARVSHDLKSPLTSIIGYSELICAHEAPTAAEKSRIIYQSARRLLNLVNDLIDYATGDKHAEKLQLRPVYSVSFFNSITEEARLLAQINQNQFVYSQQGELPNLIEIDSKRVHQILINLLSNACKFTHKGRIVFSLNAQQIDEQTCELTFTVEDNGSGIEPSQLHIIFEPFKRLPHHNTVEGLGLGLAIAKQWANIMNATLDAQSDVDKGTRMTCQLRAKIAHETALAQEHLVIENDTLPAFDGQQRQIWLIEDTASILNLLQTELEGLNLNVTPMSSGEQAINLIQQPNTAQPDLIITDFHLPDFNGKAILNAARQRWPEQAVLLISAAYSQNDDTESTQLFTAVLLKPIELAKLRQTLMQLFNTATPDFDDTIHIATPSIQTQLTPVELTELTELINCYAVSDIIEWVDKLIANKPDLTDSLLPIKRLARNSDIRRLQNLLEYET